MKLFNKNSKKENLGLLQAEIQTSVSFTSFFTAVTLFFVGLLITQYKNFDPSVSIPVLFLILSTFGFLYSTLIFANASGKIARFEKKDIKKDLALGNSLSEYFGVYLLVLSIPLVINVITEDSFLKIATIIAALGGLTIYHFAGFSIMGRSFRRAHYILLLLIIALEGIMFLFQFNNIFYFTLTAIVLIVMLIAVSVFSRE